MDVDSDLLVRFILFTGVIVLLIVATGWLLKKLGHVSSRIGRYGEAARLSVSEAIAVDHRRKLVLVKRDHVEHLILIGGENDLLLEHAIPPHARPQPKASPQPQQGQQAQSKSTHEAGKNNSGNATKAPAVASQKTPEPVASASEAEISKSAPSSKAGKLASPISSAISALSSKSDKTGKQSKEHPAKPQEPKNSNGSKGEVRKAPLSPQATASPAPSPASENKTSQQDAQPDLMANWRPARPQVQPTQPPTRETPTQKMDTSQSLRGPMVPAPAPVQTPAPQQPPAQPNKTPAQQAPTPQQPIQSVEAKEQEPGEVSNNDKADNKPKQQTPDDQQTIETNYQDEITRLLDELSNDSNKS